MVSESISDYSSLASSGLGRGLEMLWHFDEGSLGSVYGGDFADDTGHGNTAFQSGGFQSGGTLSANAAGLMNRSVSLNGNVLSTTTPYSNGPNIFTLSIWFNTVSTAGGKMLGWGDVQIGQSASYDRHLYMGWDGSVHYGVYDGANESIDVYTPYNDGRWHHLLATCAGTSSAFYVDGALKGTMTHGLPEVHSGYWRLGGDNVSGWPVYPGNYFVGRLDEAAIWFRALSAAEALQVYRRGGTRLKYRIRTCTVPTCADNQGWQGPDGTKTTYFSELSNVTGATQLAGTPSLTLGGYNLNINTNQLYIQYQAVLESDDAAKLCTYNSLAAPCSAENTNVTFSRVNYDATSPNVTNANVVAFNTLTSFADTAGYPGCPGGVTYTLSPNSTTYYWYSAGTWSPSDGTVAKTNSRAQLTASALKAFGTQFGVSQTYFQAYLTSLGILPCTLENVVMMGTQ